MPVNTPTLEADDDGSAPEASPTRVPRPSPTPVVTEIVPVTPVAGAMTVLPNDYITLTEGNVSVMLRPISRARVYQAALSIDDAPCSDATVLPPAWFTMTLYSAEGERENDPRLISPAWITITLDAETVSELGGMGVLLQAHALGGVSLLSVSHSELDSCDGNQFELEVERDGTAIVSAETRRISGHWALALDAVTLVLAHAQLSAALGTPTATPIPTPTVVPVPTPTMVPVPTPTTEAAPDAALPVTGDSIPTLSMILTLTAAAVLIALYGARIISARTRQRKSSTRDDGAARMSDRWA